MVMNSVPWSTTRTHCADAQNTGQEVWSVGLRNARRLCWMVMNSVPWSTTGRHCADFQAAQNTGHLRKMGKSCIHSVVVSIKLLLKRKGHSEVYNCFDNFNSYKVGVFACWPLSFT